MKNWFISSVLGVLFMAVICGGTYLAIKYPMIILILLGITASIELIIIIYLMLFGYDT